MTFPVRYDRFLASYSIQKSGFTNKTFFREKNGQKSYLTQCARKKYRAVPIKITDFDYFFRDAWDGWWVHPESKNFGPAPLAWAQGLVLGAKNGHFGHFPLQKNHLIC